MFPKTIQIGSVIFIMHRNKHRADLDYALYFRALCEVHPEAKIAQEVVRKKSAAIAAMQLRQQIQTEGEQETTETDNAINAATIDVATSIVGTPEIHVGNALIKTFDVFCKIASHTKEAPGVPFTWPAPTADPSEIDRAYEWLLRQEDLTDALLLEVESIELPNGVAGAHPSQLTEEQRANPLSEGSAPNGKLPVVSE